MMLGDTLYSVRVVVIVSPGINSVFLCSDTGESTNWLAGS